MNLQRGVLAAYQVLLRLYPPAFRRRFAPEMLELAAAAEPAEWPLIFGDTGVAIVRCWLEGSASTAVLAEPNAYVPVGEFRFDASRVMQGLVLSIAIIFGLTYASYRWPPPCPTTRQVVTRIVEGPASAAGVPAGHAGARERTPR